MLLILRDERLLAAFCGGKSDIADELVFPSQAGTPIEMNNFYARVFKPLVTRAGLRMIRFHDLRHTFGSLLIQTGASLAYVRDQMGHSSIQVTVDVYGHLIPGANITFVDRLDASSSQQQSPMPPQCAASHASTGVEEVLSSLWLGAGTRTPIYRSRVLLNPNQLNKIRDLAAKYEQLRLIPQCSRNENCRSLERDEAENASVQAVRGTLRPRVHMVFNDFDSEEDTLP